MHCYPLKVLRKAVIGGLLAVLLLSGFASAQPLYSAAQAALVVGRFGDTLTTWQTNSYPNLVETNPLFARPDGTAKMPKLILYQSVSTVAGLVAMWGLKKSGHPRVAAAVGLAFAARPTYCTIHGIVKLRQ